MSENRSDREQAMVDAPESAAPQARKIRIRMLDKKETTVNLPSASGQT
ncbi:MAG: hypothetical protein HOV68_12040 [Streptomycetaceae bacterium]|nr:hypothetical protein [Streptomycetaceae bacterium]